MRTPTFLALAALSAGFALLSVSARADDPASPPAPPTATVDGPPVDGTTPPPPARGNRRHGAGGAGYVLADLTQKLGLTPEQQKTVGGYLAGARSQARGLREDDSLSKEDRRAKMMEILATTKAQIRGALTADQQKIFDTLRPARGGAAPAPATPPVPTPPPTP